MSDIDDPFKASDSTVIRPRPGAGRRGSGDTIVPGHASEPNRSRNDGLAAPEPMRAKQARPVTPGLNPLLQAASAVLVLAGRIRSSLSGFDIPSLRRHGLEEIRRFEETARGAGISNEVVIAARYALCSTLDEAVLSTPWGGHSDWRQQSLLVALYREAWGGEKVFQLIERIIQDPAKHIDLIELHYLCLAVGFAGQYQVLDRGHARLAEIQQRLYQIIRSQRGGAPPELSPQWRGREDRRPRVVQYVPWWVVGSGVLAALTLAFVLFYTWLNGQAQPIYQALLEGSQQRERVAPPPAPASGPRLKVLLAPEEQRGELEAVEEGGRTRVILVASELFASGSATPSATYADLLARIGSAIERVPGHVRVEGHTDDQPLRSFRYANNFELSRERAINVARLLQQRVSDASRFETLGAGSSGPRYTPASDPQNRARNRRVEIIHEPVM